MSMNSQRTNGQACPDGAAGQPRSTEGAILSSLADFSDGRSSDGFTGYSDARSSWTAGRSEAHVQLGALLAPEGHLQAALFLPPDVEATVLD